MANVLHRMETFWPASNVLQSKSLVPMYVWGGVALLSYLSQLRISEINMNIPSRN
jgi:uncharacterized membrane protein YjfL (UPF0719 family)